MSENGDASPGRGVLHCLDLFSGLGGFSKAFEESDRWEVTTVDIEERFGPDIQADVMDLRPGDLPDADLVLASPPCTQFSMAASRYERFVDGEPNTPEAADAVALVYHTIGLIKAISPRYWYLENPQGYLRQVLGEPTGRVTYCQYGTEYMKPTDLWGNHPAGFTYRSCSYGSACHVHNTDQENGGLGNMGGIQSYTRDPAERAKVPAELSKAVRDAVEDAIDTPQPEQTTLIADGGESLRDGTPRVLDLYCGRGGVGLTLDELGVDHVGVDIEDYSETYPGEFLQADASEFVGGGFDLVWASPPCTAYSDLSPTFYGSREAAMEACPTIPELCVREIADRAGAEFVIENVPRASRVGHLRDAARVNGLAFGKPYDLERHFETSFPVPDACEPGEPSVTVQTRDDDDQSISDLATAKGVPASWGKKGVRSAIPREFVGWVLSFCPTLDVERPTREQAMLTEVGACAE